MFYKLYRMISLCAAVLYCFTVSAAMKNETALAVAENATSDSETLDSHLDNSDLFPYDIVPTSTMDKELKTEVNELTAQQLQSSFDQSFESIPSITFVDVSSSSIFGDAAEPLFETSVWKTEEVDAATEYMDFTYESKYQASVTESFDFSLFFASLTESDLPRIMSATPPLSQSHTPDHIFHTTKTSVMPEFKPLTVATPVYSKLSSPTKSFVPSPRPIPQTQSPVQPPAIVTSPAIYSDGQYFVAIKSDNCPKFKVTKFDHELTKALSSLGVLNVSANIARTKCQTQLNVNITAMAPYSAIRLLEESRRHNLTVTVFNRTFKIVDIQKLGSSPKDTIKALPKPTVTSVLVENEFSAYAAVLSCVVLTIMVCTTVCCSRCSSRAGKRPRMARSSLRTDGYTLTPLPRNGTLYVDYYRNSFSADMRSTTSAGSVASTSPIGEKVVQPFDTCIVPLEDSGISTLPDGSRRGSVESAPADDRRQPSLYDSQGMLTLDIPMDSRQRLHPDADTFPQMPKDGVSNPTYQRY